MNIAFIAGRDMRVRDDTDGSTVLIRHLAEYLASRGHVLDIYIPDEYRGGAHQKEPLRAEENWQITSANIRFVRFSSETPAQLPPHDTPEQYFLNRLIISDKEAEYFSLNRLENYDCIYVFHVAHTFGLISKGLLPLHKTVLFPMLLGTYYRQFMPVPDVYIQRERSILAHFRHISCASSAEVRSLIEDYGLPQHTSFVVGRGYDDNVFHPLERTSIDKSKPIHIICANSIRPQKGQDFFISLVEYVHTRGIDLVIHLVGVNGKTHSPWYNEYAATITRNISERGLERHFDFRQAVTQPELAGVMEKCHLAFYPSVTETFGKSVLESTASGLPTIVFDDVPCFSDYLEDRQTGMRVTRSVDAAYRAIEELANNHALYASISKNGIIRGEHYTWHHVLEKLRYAHKTHELPEL